MPAALQNIALGRGQGPRARVGVCRCGSPLHSRRNATSPALAAVVGMARHNFRARLEDAAWT